jgi:hypothetical protein
MENRGGCMCGKTRYKVSGEPVGGVFYCHCNDCKKQTGSPFTIAAGFLVESFAFEDESHTKTHVTVGDSGTNMDRVFCGNCGSPIYSRTELVSGVLYVKIGTLDDASWVEPPIEIYTKDKIKCAVIPSDITGFEQLMPME